MTPNKERSCAASQQSRIHGSDEYIHVLDGSLFNSTQTMHPSIPLIVCLSSAVATAGPPQHAQQERAKVEEAAERSSVPAGHHLRHQSHSQSSASATNGLLSICKTRTKRVGERVNRPNFGAGLGPYADGINPRRATVKQLTSDQIAELSKLKESYANHTKAALHDLAAMNALMMQILGRPQVDDEVLVVHKSRYLNGCLDDNGQVDDNGGLVEVNTLTVPKEPVAHGVEMFLKIEGIDGESGDGGNGGGSGDGINCYDEECGACCTGPCPCC